MTRTAAREIAVGLIFAAAMTGQEPETVLESFFEDGHYKSLSGEDELFAEAPDSRQAAYIMELVGKTFEHRAELEEHIAKYSRGWRPERISKTASAVLYCALCEILYVEDVPASVAINEAVELAKGYDEPETVAFINGVLGGFMRGELGCGAPGAEPCAEAETETAGETEAAEASEATQAPEEAEPDETPGGTEQ